MNTGSRTEKQKVILGVVACLAIIISVGSVLLQGCRSDDHMATQSPSPEAIQKRIQAIRNDPHMPQFAKDAAISRLQASGNQNGAH